MDRRDRGWEFIDLAELGINTRRSYVVSLARIVLLPLAFLLLFGAAVALAVVAGHRLPPSSSPLRQLVELSAGLGIIVVAGFATAWSVARTHRRPWLSLISPDLTVDWRRLAIGAGVEVFLVAGIVYPLGLLSAPPWRFASAAAIPVLCAALLLFPFQAASEEILFRGYLTQALGRTIRSQATIAAIVGLIFAVLHFNAYGAWTIPYIFLLSLVFSLVSLHDGRLELVIGAHAANNLLAYGALGLSEIQLTWPAVALVPVHGVLFYGLSRALTRLWCAPRPAR